MPTLVLKISDIKCRYAGLNPAAVVLVAHRPCAEIPRRRGQARSGQANAEAVRAGAVNLARHIENLQGLWSAGLRGNQRIPH